MILTAILEFVEICLMNNNIPQAQRLLSDAEVLLHQVRCANKNSEIENLNSNLKNDELIVILDGRCLRPTTRNR